MKLKLIIGSVVLLTLGLQGCYYDNLEEMYPMAGLTNVCDTSKTISYSNDLQPIFVNSCGATNTACHKTGNPTPFILDNYAGVVNTISISPNPFLGVIKHDASVPSVNWMPQGGGKLDDCSIMKIEKWINAGQPNN
jgi:hypothetical protein